MLLSTASFNDQQLPPFIVKKEMNILRKVVTLFTYSQGLLSPRKERSIDFFLYDLKES
jgi:hypothetical protein